jgi:CheY-like chemotaxis protein
MTNRPATGEARPGPRRPLVLVVDDHEVGRKSLARLLEALGYEVIAVNDGTSALEVMKGPARLDYVLTDLRLPDFDGREVVQAARQLAPIPRIGLITGWDMEADESHRLGIDWVFLKPLNVQEIVARLREAPPPDLVPDID